MDLIEVRRKMLMGQKIPEQWDYEFIKPTNYTLWNVDVTAGQRIIVQWETPPDVVQNSNAWIVNGNGCCANVAQVRILGENGTVIRDITATGQIKVGGYNGGGTFDLRKGSIIRIKFV